MAASTSTRSVDRSYLIHEQLGEGGMGAVYRATQLISGQSVALKLIKLSSERHRQTSQPPTNVETKLRLALAREFQTLASLHHPNVIRVLSYGFDDELGPYFTMELLDAPQTLLQAAANLPLAEKIFLLGQLFRALIYIHQRGILHRDIKPSAVVGFVAHRKRTVQMGCGQIVDGFGLSFLGSELLPVMHRDAGARSRTRHSLHAAPKWPTFSEEHAS